MKSEIYTECETAPHYPILAEYIHKDADEDERFVVMFTDIHEGVVVHIQHNSPRKLGEHCDTLYNWQDKERWRILSDKESICLNNTWK